MFSLLVLGIILGVGEAFPSGAPVEACIFQEPKHGHVSQPHDTLGARHDFYATQGTFGLGLGNNVTVHLTGKPIKGFFIQAVDDVYKPIGKFVKNDFSKLHSECAAITHSHPGPKKDLSFIWQAPKTSKTQNVYFRATILEEYDKYWSKVFAKVLQPSHF